MYAPTDSFRKSLKTQIRREFNHLSLLSFDELNVVRISNELKSTYGRLMDFNLKGYRKIVEEAHEYALTLLTEEEKKKESKVDFVEDEFIEYLFTTYNYVTGYLYKKEAERKRLRQGEEMATAREYRDRPRYRKTLEKSANLWFTQSGQYAIDLEDYTVLETLRRAGVEKVQWIAEDDFKTCAVCRKLDGMIYDIDKVPHKTHYNCRCMIIPYKDMKDFA